MNPGPHLGTWGAKTNVALIFASIAAVLVGAAVVTAFVVDPPALGWVAFAIASAAVGGLGAAATVLLSRMRVSPPTPALAADREGQLLVVADAYCREAALCDEIQARLDGAVAVHLVVPVRVSHLHFLANDEAEERREAKETMQTTVGLLRQRSIRATGAVGSDKPLESMTDALATFPATAAAGGDLAPPALGDNRALATGELALLAVDAQSRGAVEDDHEVVPLLVDVFRWAGTSLPGKP